MKLSNQAMGAIMMALQKSLLEQSDIVPVLKSFEFKANTSNGKESEELVVLNPPTFKMGGENIDFNEEITNTLGSD